MREVKAPLLTLLKLRVGSDLLQSAYKTAVFTLPGGTGFQPVLFVELSKSTG